MGMTAVTWLPLVTDPNDAVVFVFPYEYKTHITYTTLLWIRSVKARTIQITKIKELIREGNSHSYNKSIDTSEENFHFDIRFSKAQESYF